MELKLFGDFVYSNVSSSPVGEEKRSYCSNNVSGQTAQGRQHRGHKSKPKHIPVLGELNVSVQGQRLYLLSLPVAVCFANLPAIIRKVNKLLYALLLPFNSQVPIISRQWSCLFPFVCSQCSVANESTKPVLGLDGSADLVLHKH